MSWKLAPIALAAGLIVPVGATASWEQDEEWFQWSMATLTWAQIDDPTHPPIEWIQENYEPAPREPWCFPASGVQPTQQACDQWENDMDDWRHYFLEIPYGQPLPQAVPYPNECPSQCQFTRY